MIRSEDSKIETLFRKELWRNSFRYRKNSGKYFGKPDIILKKHKAVIFIDSCFWHGCEQHCRVPTAHKTYWAQKITRNITRDKEVSKHYKNRGWKIFRVWEHNLKNNPRKIVKIINFLNKLRKIK